MGEKQELTVIVECINEERLNCEFVGIECYRATCPYLLINSVEPKAETETPQCNCGAVTQHGQRTKLQGVRIY